MGWKRNWTAAGGDGCNFRRRAGLYFLLVKQLETLTHAKDRSIYSSLFTITLASIITVQKKYRKLN